ncbi:hypothetical protein AWZ03_004324 [Drosophila navojoa]|uniref:Osiris 23 n=1 Tax=Drosophila navojoa TaxID=7232 RepID=A0A484BN03_DRONA|nr:uncharacterized protein LOC108659729 [Drosophila navojoa]TDG49235.1 hypothetical protein AWZ03_004324 [Drosophila navojoa]
MQVKFTKSVCLLAVCLLLLQLVAGREEATVKPTQTTDTRVSWIAQLLQLRQQLRTCFRSGSASGSSSSSSSSSSSGSGSSLWSCFRARSLKIFEDIMAADVIPLYEGVRLIAAPNATNGQARPAADEPKDLKHLTWFDQLAVSLAKGLTTHTLQINLAKLTERYLSNDGPERKADTVGSARLRRHRFNMIITMMFGVTALGAVLVPMGFQLLAIVSGKALLLAKMALLLASINGLKRVANTGLHYGLYHVPGEHLGGYYDRGDLSHPRNVPIPVGMAPSVEFGLK